jgi:hypothetical protein
MRCQVAFCTNAFALAGEDVPARIAQARSAEHLLEDLRRDDLALDAGVPGGPCVVEDVVVVVLGDVRDLAVADRHRRGLAGERGGREGEGGVGPVRPKQPAQARLLEGAQRAVPADGGARRDAGHGEVAAERAREAEARVEPRGQRRVLVAEIPVRREDADRRGGVLRDHLADRLAGAGAEPIVVADEEDVLSGGSRDGGEQVARAAEVPLVAARPQRARESPLPAFDHRRGGGPGSVVAHDDLEVGRERRIALHLGRRGREQLVEILRPLVRGDAKREEGF